MNREKKVKSVILTEKKTTPSFLMPLVGASASQDKSTNSVQPTRGFLFMRDLNCSVDGCSSRAKTKFYCLKHYNNWQRTGHPLGKFKGDRKALGAFFSRINRKFHNCRIEHCSLPHYAKHLCENHYTNFRNTGSPFGKYHKCFVDNCNYNTKYKYCSRHSRRAKLHRSLDLSVKYTLKGKRHPRWNGGVSAYPNHYLMKKNRLIILMQNPKCEYCGRKATEVHHRDGTKTNHSIKNLQPICKQCHIRTFPKTHISKNIQTYGFTLASLSKMLGYAYGKIYYLHITRRLKRLISL